VARKARATLPDARPARTGSRSAHCARGEEDLPIACLERSLALEFSQYEFRRSSPSSSCARAVGNPTSEKGEFGLEVVAALEGLDRPPSRYHRAASRSSSIGPPQYDERVLREVYAEHTQVAQALARLGHGTAPLRVLDLGCGTACSAEALVGGRRRGRRWAVRHERRDARAGARARRATRSSIATTSKASSLPGRASRFDARALAS
jgi:hypothetical protein